MVRVFQEHTSAHAQTAKKKKKNPGTHTLCIIHKYIKYLRVLQGAHTSIQTVDKCAKWLGPSHEWSKRSVSCMMVVRSLPDGLGLSGFTLFSCLYEVPAGICSPVDMVVGFRLWGCEIHTFFLECFMHYLLFIQLLYKTSVHTQLICNRRYVFDGSIVLLHFYYPTFA